MGQIEVRLVGVFRLARLELDVFCMTDILQDAAAEVERRLADPNNKDVTLDTWKLARLRALLRELREGDLQARAHCQATFRAATAAGEHVP